MDWDCSSGTGVISRTSNMKTLWHRESAQGVSKGSKLLGVDIKQPTVPSHYLGCLIYLRTLFTMSLTINRRRVETRQINPKNWITITRHKGQVLRDFPSIFQTNCIGSQREEDFTKGQHGFLEIAVSGISQKYVADHTTQRVVTITWRLLRSEHGCEAIL